MDSNWKKVIFVVVALVLGGFFVWGYGGVLGWSLDNTPRPSATPLKRGLYSDFSVTSLEEGNKYSYPRFNSPDEMANYYFVRSVAEGSGLAYEEPLNSTANNLLQPRSVNVVGERVVPGSFFGIHFVYGNLGKVFGVDVIPWLTPFFAVLGALFFGLLVARVFGREVGVISALLMLTLAPWRYFASRVMYHNVLFSSLLIVGIYFLDVFLRGCVRRAGGRSLFLCCGTRDYPQTVLAAETKNDHLISEDESQQSKGFWWGGEGGREVEWLMRVGASMLAGFFVGLALVTRTSEIGWVSAVVGLLFLFNIRKFYWPGVFVFFATLVATFVPVIVTNYELYGAAFSIGYQDVAGRGVSSISVVDFLKLVFVPFGLSLAQMKVTIVNYIFNIFWWWATFSILGFLSWIIFAYRSGGRSLFLCCGTRDYPQTVLASETKNDHLAKHCRWLFSSQVAYITGYWLLVIGLLFLYGSWGVVDRVDGSQYSIGTSYVRYFLPIYIGALPFIAFLVWKLVSFFKKGMLRWGFVLIFITLFSYPSHRLVLHTTDESLFSIRDTLAANEVKAGELLEIIPEDAVAIIYPQLDKVLFPERKKLITALVNDEDYRAVRRLLDGGHEVIYITHATSEMVAEINEKDFALFGMEITEGRYVNGFDWVYKIGVRG